jgi:hypothetical protein
LSEAGDVVEGRGKIAHGRNIRPGVA